MLTRLFSATFEVLMHVRQCFIYSAPVAADELPRRGWSIRKDPIYDNAMSTALPSTTCATRLLMQMLSGFLGTNALLCSADRNRSMRRVENRYGNMNDDRNVTKCFMAGCKLFRVMLDRPVSFIYLFLTTKSSLLFSRLFISSHHSKPPIQLILSE